MNVSEETSRRNKAASTVEHHNPVTVTASEAIGTAFLGLLAQGLLIALLRSQARNRALLRQLAGEG